MIVLAGVMTFLIDIHIYCFGHLSIIPTKKIDGSRVVYCEF